MPNVMADQPNIGGESSVIPFFVARRKFWLMSAAQVPYSNAANIGKGKTWDAKWILHLAKFRKPPKMYKCIMCKVWLASGERRRCSNEGKTRKPLTFAV